jgi:hypothetical protein
MEFFSLSDSGTIFVWKRNKLVLQSDIFHFFIFIFYYVIELQIV